MLFATLSITACKKDDSDDDNKTNNENNNSSNTETSDNLYTVTVLDGDKNPVEGVGIGMMLAGTFTTKTTDKDGKITFESEDEGVNVMIMSVPTGYDKPQNAIQTFEKGSRELTLTVNKTVKNTVLYTVTVTDQFGDPVVGAIVQLCTDTMCYDTTTDENGVGTKELTPNIKYDIKVHAPEGYTAPEGYFAELAAGSTEIEIEITKD